MRNKWIVKAPSRLDAFLANQVEDLSRSRIQKLIEIGKVEVNGKRVTKTSRSVRVGDTVVATGELEPHVTEVKPTDLELTILYEDDACLVIDKPAGFAVHPGAAMDQSEVTILNGIAHLFDERSLPFSEDAVLVHRLDKETTGALLIAKTPKAHEALQQQFESRSVSKTYLALVAGVPSPAAAVIDAPIGRNLTDRTKMSVLKTSVSREAKTTYRTVAATGEVALVECDLHTGRTHQVRVHLFSIGHPILGDRAYASSESQKLSDRYGIDSVCLHAWKLSFVSPLGEKVEVVAPLPDSLRSGLKAVGIE